MTHIIRQQHLHVDLNGSESDGRALQSRLSDLYHHWLMPALERALDRCAPPDAHLYIDRLEIDAGTLSLDRLEHDLADVVAQAIEKLIPTQPPSVQLVPTANLIVGEYRTTQQAIQEAFLYFLKTGSLPWSFHLPADQTLEQAVLNSWQESTPVNVDFRSINEPIRFALASPNARKRLVLQFSSAFLKRIVSRLFAPGKSIDIDQILEILHRFAIKSEAVTYLERQLWETVFGYVAAEKPISEEAVIRQTWRNLPMSIRKNEELAKSLERHWPGLTTFPLADETSEKHSNVAKSPVKLDTTRLSPETRLDTKEDLYIDNAGLVLLYPFLPQLFSALGMTDAEKLLEPDRALSLLHFLATGQLIAPEYKLLLPKLLCNVVLDVPVDSNVVLTDAAKEEAEALLGAVIRHWGALGNTSIDGLRGEFLVRPGKLSVRYDGDWLLQVEASTVDILLDQLPWGIGMIKLPWMERVLWVEWQ